MATSALYWGVGAHAPVNLPMQDVDFCAHLLADWIPSLHPSVSKSFIGWPLFLLDSVSESGTDYVNLRPNAGWSDRQWKGVLSWMMGVAGARHVLASEGYVWVAPLSAFYPGTTTKVDTFGWNPAYLPGPRRVQAHRSSNSPSKLRPDYVAQKPDATGSGIEWAVAECKGTSTSLRALNSCPPAWHHQVHNATITDGGSPVTLSRRIVVATRSNPNAKNPKTRRVQIRAWNDRTNPTPSDRTLSDPDVIAAHFVGLCSNLGLWNNVSALRMSAYLRTASPKDGARRRAVQTRLWRIALGEQNTKADTELHRLGDCQRKKEEGQLTEACFSHDTCHGTLSITVHAAAVNLIRALRSEADAAALDDVVRLAERSLAAWYDRAVSEDAPTGQRRAIQRCGLAVSLDSNAG